MEERRAIPVPEGETQLTCAARGILTREAAAVARDEGIPEVRLLEDVAAGRAIVPANRGRIVRGPIGIGSALRCKVNANIGNSSLESGEGEELEKLGVALACRADTVMDLSTGRRMAEIRGRILAESPIPVGTVPIYEALERAGSIDAMDADVIFRAIEEQARQGVDYVTVHCGVLREFLPLAASRRMGIVSRGGSILARWMEGRGRENPLYEEYDRLLEIARRHDLTLSLGDGLRPGCLADATDAAQIAELRVLGELGRRARARGVQVMIEGPGHIPLHEVRRNVELQIELCDGAPFYVLGPVVTDVAPGYDHITSAIGAAIAAWAGAAMICYVTPREHLGLPRAEDVRDGLIAARIAAHAADVARGVPGARTWDDEMARARFSLDWERQFSLAIDPARARELRGACGEDACSMCGPAYCAIRLSRAMRREEAPR
ncbi:MAG: phosphomethylpyrimidine synthase ThiC [Planctomycetes bacterium]|nr:phosphomethylpyrimidine synthase ThiC [Planctomycetota bacterium]